MAADPEIEVEDVVYEGESTVMSLRLLPLIRTLQAKHGLRHGDYQRYRGYCGRRLARLRKVLDCRQGDRKKFVRKDVTVEVLKKASKVKDPTATEAKHLQVPLVSAERAWAYAMQLKFEMNSEPRKKFHMINRLRKAKVHADQLADLVMAEESPVDAVTKLEVQAYAAWMAGNLSFESGDWQGAKENLTAARTIYEKLSMTFSAEEGQVYRTRMDEIVPNLRYCAYNIGDTTAKQDLLNLRSSRMGGDHEQLDELIRETREQQAATLQEVEWRGRKMAVRQEKARSFLLRIQEFSSEVEEEGMTLEETVSSYESLLMDCKDAIQALKVELAEDPAFRNRQQAGQGPVSSAHFLLTYLSFLKCSKVVDRNLAMIRSMKKVLDAEEQQEKGKKPVKPQDMVRLYDNIIQNLNDIKNLAGLEEDVEFQRRLEAEVACYKGFRSYYIAMSFMSGRKWAEAMALFQKVSARAAQSLKDPDLQEALKAELGLLTEAVERRQFMAHANSILESQADRSDAGHPVGGMLLDRLDVYNEDADLAKGKAQLAKFPPSFQPIPCKPLYFDLAREHLEFPNLESKLKSGQAEASSGQAGSSGWLGGWLGGWGSKK